MYKITNTNIKEWAKNYDGEQFDGILCDPPYELGFMGKSWDSSGIAFDTDMWQDIYKLLKPGAHLLAFSGSRTYHRMAVAIEDAGFEIRDQLIWMYGSGFPKSHNVANAVDKLGGAGNRGHAISSGSQIHPTTGKKRANGELLPAYKARTEAGQVWEGYGTALKPAHEPCVLARKPIEGTVANNVLKHGTGGLNIDGTRVTTGENLNGGAYSNNRETSTNKVYGEYQRIEDDFSQPTGRFPSNLIHDGSDEVEAVFPQTKSAPRTATSGGTGGVGVNTSFQRGSETGGFTDSGSASRYFYTAKASKRERNAGLEGFEEVKKNTLNSYGDQSDVEQGDGATRVGDKGSSVAANFHPTVKPISLTKYLATLIKPPTGGRLLVPFSGSGSEMIGALQAGWGHVEGVELTEEYIPIAEARIKYWLEQKEIEETKPEQVVLV